MSLKKYTFDEVKNALIVKPELPIVIPMNKRYNLI